MSRSETLTPASAPLLPMTEEERQALIHNASRHINASLLETDGPPGYKRYWMNYVTQPGAVSLKETQGFRIARDDPKAPPEKRIWKANGFRDDGTYMLGDLILMYVPQEVWDMYEKQNLDRANRFSKEVKKAFKQQNDGLEGEKGGRVEVFDNVQDGRVVYVPKQ